MKLIRTKKFSKQAAKLISYNPQLRNKLSVCLHKLTKDPFHPALFTHKLKGALNDKFSARLTYELRIIFKFEMIEKEEYVLLLAIGTHDAVY